MSVNIEFYGIPRSRAGVSATTVDFDGAEIRLGDLLLLLAQRFPNLADDCFDGMNLKPNITANLGGDCFVTEADTLLKAGACLLLLSADAGG